jgi:hypothetical protein
MQGPPLHWRGPWLSTDLMLPGITAACVSANDGLGKQLNNNRQLAARMRAARAA